MDGKCDTWCWCHFQHRNKAGWFSKHSMSDYSHSLHVVYAKYLKHLKWEKEAGMLFYCVKHDNTTFWKKKIKVKLMD